MGNNDQPEARRCGGNVEKQSRTFILTNINRLMTSSGRKKSGFLANQAELNNALFVAVTETWLNDKMLDSEPKT